MTQTRSSARLLRAFMAPVMLVTVVAPVAAQTTAPRLAVSDTAPRLPVDPKVIAGRLPNGLRYYIRQNSRPEKRAELRLAVDAGSVLEANDQRGLAHFVEHMGFNGTKRFPKQTLVNFLEGIGM
ncbi:MAG: insulinase family protein, partial [Gemmatimonadota bacterium]|nr:insulinase family protein [Gemmatimonadota bacterium]